MSSPVEQIKQRLSVADVVGSYIKLQKAGANFKAVCPFHSEKSPSFYVSPAREIWHCFGCSRGGDMFEFVKQIEGVEFPEALRILAEKAGIELKEYNRDPRFKSERTRLLDLMKAASEFYEKNIYEHGDVLDYLKKRGLADETIKSFHVGYALPEEAGWRNLCVFLKNKGFTLPETEKVGLAVKNDAGDYYDRFRGRIMFPLTDSVGRSVGFSGRIFGPEKEGVGKYINTPQTILYDKSKLLYGFDKAKVEIRKRDFCILVEGQMDVILSHQADALNTVAVSGTALTPAHLETMKRLTGNLFMAFDSDEAGLSAAKRSIDLALEKDFELKAIALPAGKDPADVASADPELWQKFIIEARHIIDFYLFVLREKHKDDREFKKEIEKNILPYLLTMKSGIERSHWVSEISRRLSVKEEIVLEELKKLLLKQKSSGRSPSSDEPSSGPKKRKDLLLERLVGVVLWKKNESLVPDIVKQRVLEALSKLDETMKNKLSFEAELCYVGAEKIEEEIECLSKELKKEILKEELAKLAEEIRLCEERCQKEILEQKMSDFQKISNELSAI